jgi:tRNA1Val (adenine37-N6)-methyltransferase
LSLFKFRYFSIEQGNLGLKVGTDAMLLGAFIDAEFKKNGLDLGTGTGVLSLMQVQKNEAIQIDALEIESEASSIAQFNFQNSIWSNRLKGIEKDYLLFETDKTYDLIFSNPPFHLEQVYSPTENKKLARSSDEEHLIGIMNLASKLLTSDGDFWIIAPNTLEGKLLNWAAQKNLFPYKIILIEGKINQVKRVILNFKRQKISVERSSFIVRNDDNSYTEEYKNLTQDFHHPDFKL